MSTARGRLERLLGGPALGDLRERLRRRYELGRTNDAFTLAAISVNERSALEGLLGRRARSSSSMQISVTELSEALARAGLASSLRDALEQLDGPIRDFAGERADRAARWDAAFAACGAAPLSLLVAQSAGRGLVKRLAGADPDRGQWLLEAATHVIARLPAAGVPLSHLAAQALGDSHALDGGRPVGTLVLAALRGAEIEERPRDVWAKWGVLVNELASPALVLNLSARTDTSCGQLVQQARERGEPLHLSLRVLLRTPPRWEIIGRKVFVCENAAVVAMAADRLGTRSPPLVCTDGMPAAAQRVLLGQLAAANVTLYYHGDFDWPGVTIANFVMRSFKAQPWRFRSDDYIEATGRQLEGTAVAADWDSALAPKMAKHGCALDEEAVVDTLLHDLASQLL
jgi:uncharacterized protein (TIGR02679 family)